jgi:catechol 2,3-dioxygenase-like lactoylglutathione lyase family enzyme
MPEQIWNPMVPELIVSNYVQSLEFYTKILGFKIRFTRTNFAYLELDGIELMLEGYDPEAWITGPLEPPFGRGINFQMEVADVEGMVERLKAIDHAFFRSLRETWYETSPTTEEGQLEFLIQDPDGYLLRFARGLGTRARVTSA